MASIAKLVVSLGANISDFETDMKRASKISKYELQKMERQAKKLNDEWNRRFKLAGAAVATGLAVATKAAVDFEKAMAEVATLGAGNIERLGDSVKELAVEFGQAPTDQARALYQIISAGASDSATQLEQLTAANKLAVGGITDVATAADGLTTVLNAYEGSGLSSTNVSDILFATMKAGKTTIDELSSSVGQVATIAAQSGVSFAELGATVGTLTKSGLSTTEAMTSLRSVLSAVLKQSKQTQDAAEDIGISFDVAALKSKGLFGVLQDIANSSATEEQLSKLVGRVEGLTAVLSATRNGGAVFADLLNQISNSAGITEEALAEMTQTASFQIDRLKAAIQVLGIDIGSNFLPAIADFAEVIVENMDRVKVVVESVAAFVITRVGVGMVAAFATAAQGARALATAMAFIGGPVGLVATAVALLVVNWDDLLEREDGLGTFIRQLDRGFTVLLGVIKAVAFELGNLVQIAVDVFDLVAAPISAIITSLGLAAEALSQGRLVDAGRALGEILERSGQRATAAFDRLKGNIDDIGEGAKYMEEAWRDSLGGIPEATEDAADAFDSLAGSIGDFVSEVIGTGTASNKAAAGIKKLGDRVKDADEKLKEINKTLGEAFAILDIKVEANPFRELSKEIGNFVESVIDSRDPLEDMRDAFEDLLDKMYPGRQLAQDFASALTVLRDGADDAGWSAERLAAAELLLAENFAKANRQIFDQSNGLDILQVALDESVRILSRTFQDLFEGIASDAFDAWEAIQSGFESLAATIARTPINVVIKQIGDAFGEGGGGLSDLQLSGQFGQNLLASIGSIIGFGSADSVFGQVGSSLGQLFGKQLFAWAGNAFFPTLFQALGAWAGPIGIALGAIIGSVVGDWIGDVFGRDLQFTLGGANQQTLPDNQRIRTPLADILGLAGQGDFGSLNDPSTFGGKLAEALVSFDTEIANIFKAIGLDDETFNAVVESLENWTATFGESADAVDVLSSRFRTILSNFSTDIRNFVNGAEDFEEQIQRFGVALTAEKLVSENAEIFGDRTTADLLNVLEQFQTGAESIGETFERFLPVLNAVIGISQSLRDFAGSDPLADLDALINPLSLEQSLANVNSGILDLIANFDGSIEQFQAIGELALVARQGELQLLQQIDSVQKGLTARLQSLRDFVTGADNAPKSIAEVLAGAEGLIGKVRGARSASEVAAIGQEFDALIRTLDESQRFKAQGDLLGLINLFEGASSQSLAALRADTLENAATVREAVDLFLTEIGDPLDIIAGSLEGQNLPEVMEGGLEDINLSVQQIGPQVAGALSEVFGDGINVTVVVQDAGLVTQ